MSLRDIGGDESVTFNQQRDGAEAGREVRVHAARGRAWMFGPRFGLGAVVFTFRCPEAGTPPCVSSRASDIIVPEPPGRAGQAPAKRSHPATLLWTIHVCQ